MARVVKHEEHAVKRNEILDAAQRLVYSKGYEQMSIQDILNELKISKGAFYHYYASKQSLLEALIDRMVDEASPVIVPIVQDPQLPALEKLHRFFDTSARWKTARKDYLLLLMRVWYTDDNLLIRHKTLTGAVKRFVPMLADIIRQGVSEGVMAVTFPDQIADMAFALLIAMGEKYIELLESHPPNALQCARDLVRAYNDALERMLGAASGSIKLVDDAILQDWFETVDPVITGNGHGQLTS